MFLEGYKCFRLSRFLNELLRRLGSLKDEINDGRFFKRKNVDEGVYIKYSGKR